MEYEEFRINYLQCYRYNPINKPKAQVLLIHGAWHGSWCWENFVQKFVDDNYLVITYDLVNHFHSSKVGSFKLKSVNSHTKDLRKVVENIARSDLKFFVISHSLGGLIHRNYISKFENNFDKSVFLTPVNAKSVWKTFFRTMLKEPLTVIRCTASFTLRPFVSTQKKYIRNFYTDDKAPKNISDLYQQIQDESFRCFIDMLTLTPHPDLSSKPALMFGGLQDNLVSAKDVENLANKTQAKFQSVDSGHNIMADSQWEDTYSIIREFIEFS